MEVREAGVVFFFWWGVPGVEPEVGDRWTLKKKRVPCPPMYFTLRTQEGQAKMVFRFVEGTGRDWKWSVTDQKEGRRGGGGKHRGLVTS